MLETPPIVVLHFTSIPPEACGFGETGFSLTMLFSSPVRQDLQRMAAGNDCHWRICSITHEEIVQGQVVSCCGMDDTGTCHPKREAMSD